MACLVTIILREKVFDKKKKKKTVFSNDITMILKSFGCQYKETSLLTQKKRKYPLFLSSISAE